MQQPRCISHTEDMQILAVLILYSDCKFYYKCRDTMDMDTCNQTLRDKWTNAPPRPRDSFRNQNGVESYKSRDLATTAPPAQGVLKEKSNGSLWSCLKPHVGTRRCWASTPLALSIRSILPSSSVTIALGVIPLPPLLI